MVRFVLIVSVLLSVMVAPDRLGSNVMTAPLAALVMADRSVPGPLSALLVTTCADAVAPPAKTSMSRAGIKAAGSNKASKLPDRVRAAGFREGFKSFIFLFFKFKFHVQDASHLAHREAMRDSGAKGANYFAES